MKEDFVRGRIEKARGREKINENGGNIESLDPVSRRKVSLKEKRADHVSDGTDHALDMTVLLRGVGTRETRRYAFTREVGEKTMVAKFAPIVTLERFDG